MEKPVKSVESTLTDEERVLIAQLPRDARVVDGGAGWGEFTLEVLRHCPDAVILAVDPHPAHARILRNTVGRYDGQVEVIEAALWRESWHRRPFWVDGGEDERDFGSSLYAMPHHDPRSVPVTTAAIDDLLRVFRGMRTPDLVKLDLEGGEMDALYGLGGMRPGLVQVEYSIRTWSAAGKELAELEDWARIHGFIIRNLPPRDAELTNIILERKGGT
jgi:FkbM family methyltransferase